MPRVNLARHPRRVDVTIDGAAFTTYYFDGAQNAADPASTPLVRPYFYPVCAADGAIVTSDQFTAGGDHPHHRSLWVAHGEVNDADHWSFQQKPSPRQRHLGFAQFGEDSFEQELAWDGAGERPVPLLNERRTVRFIAFDDGARGIDLTVRLTPAGGAVTLGDTKEAGLCAVRVAKSIAAHPTLVNSQGGSGEPACWGKPARWCDLSGDIGGKVYGVAILDHPSNPRWPTTWHARGYGLMTANPFGLHDFHPGAARDGGAMHLAAGSTTVFRYRVIVHAGHSMAAAIDAKYRDYERT